MATHTSFLADLLDDLSAEDLTTMLNFLALNSLICSRANIKHWRKLHERPLREETRPKGNTQT